MTMQLSQSQQIEIWRAKARDNTLTHEDMKEFIKLQREARGKAPVAVGGSRTNKTAKAAKAKPDADDLLSQLEGL